jgi:hypothetical protein
VVWFQLAEDPFTVYSQVVADVSEGSGTISAVVDIPMSVPPGDFQYRYFAYIAPDGGGVENSFSEIFQSQVTVLGEDSQLIISVAGPEVVSQGDSVEVNVSYSAVEGQEIVVWFQLDQSPFTTYQEFRQAASTGQNEITAKLYIPLDVPVANDAYQYQTLLVPTGGSWPDRISNIAQRDIDVVMVSGTAENNAQALAYRVYPNPSIGAFTVEVPASSYTSELIVYSSLGKVIYQQSIPPGANDRTLLLDHIPQGVHWLSVRQGSAQGVVKLLKY